MKNNKKRFLMALSDFFKRNKNKITSLAAASAIIAGLPTLANADEMPNAEEMQNNEIVHIVKEGETLGKIAEFYLHDASKYEEIADYNGIEDSSLIFPNQVVRIPTGPKVENPEFEPDRIYVVKEGDGLYCIVNTMLGLKTQEAVDKLATYNNLEDPNCLYVGQILLIPCKKKLEQVQQRNYTEQYNRMGERLHQQQECYKPCELIPVCGEPIYCYDPCENVVNIYYPVPEPCEVHHHCHSMSPHH